MSFVRSLFGGLPGRLNHAAFRSAVASVSENLPHQFFSLGPINLCARYHSTAAATPDSEEQVDPKDLVSRIQCCMLRFVDCGFRHVSESFVILVSQHTSIPAKPPVPNVSSFTPAVSRKSTMSVAVTVLVRRWIPWTWKEKRVSPFSLLPLMQAGVTTTLTLLILPVCDMVSMVGVEALCA